MSKLVEEKKITKVRAEINEKTKGKKKKEMRQTVAKINETKS